MKQTQENRNVTRIIPYVEAQHSVPAKQSVRSRTRTYSKYVLVLVQRSISKLSY